MTDRQETAAWRLMGDAFVRLLRCERTDPSARARAFSLAEWLHASMLTADQQHQFMVGTGWILDAELWAELQDHVRPKPSSRRRGTRTEIPF